MYLTSCSFAASFFLPPITLIFAASFGICLFQVQMLGSGRPFLVEIQNARSVPSEVSIKEIENKINNLEHKLVSASPMPLLT